MNICEIMNHSGTDKSTVHSYCETYGKVANHFRYTSLPILEIGVHEGRSLHAWNNFFPNAQIHGIDINQNSMISGVDGITTHLINVRDLKLLSDFATKYGPFKMVVDDGSHQLCDQVLAHAILMQHIADGGAYVIEDVQSNDDLSVLRNLDNAEVVDLRHIKGRYDDIMVVFRKMAKL